MFSHNVDVIDVFVDGIGGGCGDGIVAIPVSEVALGLW
jgi:Na+-transporting NADH:ubiquinone oxidoreductase subunit NqrD